MGDDKDKNDKRKLVDVSLSPILINNKRPKHSFFLSDSSISSATIRHSVGSTPRTTIVSQTTSSQSWPKDDLTSTSSSTQLRRLRTRLSTTR